MISCETTLKATWGKWPISAGKHRAFTARLLRGFERQLVAPRHCTRPFHLFLPSNTTPCTMKTLRASSAMPAPRCKTFAVANMAVCCPFCLARQLRARGGGGGACGVAIKTAGGRTGGFAKIFRSHYFFRANSVAYCARRGGQDHCGICNGWFGRCSPLLPRGGPRTFRFVQNTNERRIYTPDIVT